MIQNKFSSFFQKPHPYIFTTASYVTPGVITILILVLLRPFYFAELDGTLLISIAMSIGVIVSVSIYGINRFLKSYFPELISEEKWTIGRELLLTLLVLFAIVQLIFVELYAIGISREDVLLLYKIVVLYTLAISVLPIFVMTIIDQFFHLKKQHQLVLEINHQLKTSHHNDTVSHISLIAENGQIELQLHPEELIVIQSEGNYLDVYYQKDGITQKKLIRNRLKVINETLQNTRFYQCHRSYIINLDRVIHIDGNARNLEVSLRGMEQKIPVARSKTTELSYLLQSR